MANPKQQNSYPLRMPNELRERLEEVAKSQGKSVNALIVQLVQDALDYPPGDVTAIPSPTLLHEVMVRYGKVVNIEIRAVGETEP